MTKYYIIPENEQKVDCLYAALSTEEKGERIVMMMGAMGVLPLVFPHKSMLEEVRPLIEKSVKESGRSLSIYKFTCRELLEVVE